MKLDYETVDSIVVARLKETFRDMTELIDAYELTMESRLLKDYENEDYVDALKLRKATKRLLRYFMIRDEANEWIKDNK